MAVLLGSASVADLPAGADKVEDSDLLLVFEQLEILNARPDKFKASIYIAFFYT
jgi:hypothetical protein